MKPIEYCLDVILTQLEANWLFEKRPKLNRVELLNKFELPNRDEYFKGLIDKLVEEGYVELLDDHFDDADYYKARSIITVTGYYFIKDGGYTKKKENLIYENTQLGKLASVQNRNQRRLVILTRWIAGGTVVAGMYYLLEVLKHFNLF